MAATFRQSQAAANTYLNQAQNQLDTAVKLNGELGGAVATRQINRSETLYGQVNTFLGLATTSNSRAYTEINDMARQAVGPVENQDTRTSSTVYQTIQRGIDATRTAANALLAKLNTIRYDEANNTPKPAANSSGEEVIQEQKANSDDALVQNPSGPLQTFDKDGNLIDVEDEVSEDTNATEPKLLNDTDIGDVDGSAMVGGDREVVTTGQTQDGKESAPSDDSRDQSPSVVGSGVAEGGAVAVAPEFLQPIVAQPNPLNRLASMTYTISIYIMNLDEYKQLLVSQRKILPTQQLIVQSGGIDQGVGFGIGQRNKYFDVDFYVDDLEIESSIGTQGGTRSHNGLLMKFTIVEPNGITFLSRLRNAVREHQANSNLTTSELNANFLMVIRFYGYDSAGNLVNGSQLGIKEVGSDNNAVVEKWFPFQLNNVHYRIGNKLVEYKCQATCPQVNVAFSQMRASIPFDFQLTAPDVKTLLNGKTSLTTTQANDATETNATDGVANAAPAKASDLSSKKTYTNGLAEALNQWQQDQVKNGDQLYPDEYVINIESASGLIDAKIARQGVQEKNRTAQAPANTAREALDPKVGSYDKDSKNWSVTRGTPIAQLIDLVMRNSTYITKQQNLIYDPEKQTYRPQTPTATFQWFRIRCQVTPLKYDTKRRDFSYRIVYTISRYQVNDPRISVFPRAPYRGAHKIYNWLFTGENSEVLDLDLNVEYNYVTPFATKMNQTADLTVADLQLQSSGRIYERRLFQNKPNSEGTGGTSDTTTAAAAVAERYYTDGDIQKSTLTILGDPDLLQQSDVFYNSPANIYLKPFMPDGSVNSDASEILYEIRFNPVTDYAITDGLAHVNANNTAYSQATGERNLPSESSVFALARVTSLMKQGKFTQKLVGTIRRFDPTTATPGAATLAQGSGTATTNRTADDGSYDRAEANRLANYANRNNQNVTGTGTVPAPEWTDPMGTTDPAAIVNSVSNPAPKEGSNTVSDDALSTGTPFIGA